MNDKKNIFIIDDDSTYIETTKSFLEDNGFKVISATTGKQAIPLLNKNFFDVLILDKNLPDMTGIDILQKHLPTGFNFVIIMVTAEPSIYSAVEAIKLGANDYISKPHDELELLFKIKKELKFKELKEDHENLHMLIDENYQLDGFIGKNRKFREILSTVQQLKNSDVTILITGETGTGKGLLAKSIHNLGQRKDKRFVTINTSTLSETILESQLFGHVKGAFTGADKNKIGLFQYANNGTVFIDEIGDIPLHAQIKLLRVLQDGEFEPLGGTETVKVDTRIIAATHHDLKKLIKEKKFREDLYYRLNVVNLQLPSLKDRKEDIVILSDHFIKLFCKKNNLPVKKISQDVMTVFQNYSWPGNIRELENCIERMVLLEKNNLFTVDSLPEDISKTVSTVDTSFFQFPEKKIEELEVDYLVYLIKKYNAQITKISQICGIDRRTIYRKLHSSNIDLENLINEARLSKGLTSENT